MVCSDFSVLKMLAVGRFPVDEMVTKGHSKSLEMTWCDRI